MTSKEFIEKVLFESSNEEKLIRTLNCMTILAINEIYNTIIQSDIINNVNNKIINDLYNYTFQDKTSKIMVILDIVKSYKKLNK